MYLDTFFLSVSTGVWHSYKAIILKIIVQIPNKLSVDMRNTVDMDPKMYSSDSGIVRWYTHLVILLNI